MVTDQNSSPLVWSSQVCHVAQATFRRRLEEVQQARAKYRDANEPNELRSAASAKPTDEEEILRLCMVKWWPKVSRGDANDSELAAYIEHLLLLEPRLDDAEDLRFLDAWNNAFEALDFGRLSESNATHAANFLTQYAHALQHWLVSTHWKRQGASPPVSRKIKKPGSLRRSATNDESSGRRTMRVLLLCDTVAKARQLDRDISPVSGIDRQALVCNNSRAPILLFFLKQLARVILQGPRCSWDCLRLLLSGRLHIRTRPLADEAVLKWVRSRGFDVGLHGMGIIYRRPMIDAFRLGILNAHIGLLPKFRGRSVMEWSLLEGEANGISTFFIDTGIDTGSPILLRQEVDVSAFEGLDEAKQHLFSLDGAMFAEALRRLKSAKDRPIEQSVGQGRRYYAMSSLLREIAAPALAARKEAAKAEFRRAA